MQRKRILAALLCAGFLAGISYEACYEPKEDIEIDTQNDSTAHLTSGANQVIASYLRIGAEVVERQAFIVGVAEERVASPESSVPGYSEAGPLTEDAREALTKGEAEASERREKARRQAEEEALVLTSPDNVPNDTAGCRSYRFSYERKTAITAKSSHQYDFCYNRCSIDENGYLRDGEGRYVVAVGTAYADAVGDRIDVVYADGTVVKMVVGDFKSDRHTDPTHRFHLGWWGSPDGKDVRTKEDCEAVMAEDPALGYGWQQGDGSVIEFIIEPSVFTKARPGFVRDDNPVLKVVKILAA